MSSRIEPVDERDLHNRDIRIGVHQRKRHKHAVIKAALIVEHRVEAARRQHPMKPVSKLNRTGRRIGQLIGLRRKPVVVEIQLGLGTRGDCWGRRFPMSADQDDGLGPADRTLDSFEVGDQLDMARVSHKRHWTATVGDVDSSWSHALSLDRRPLPVFADDDHPTLPGIGKPSLGVEVVLSKVTALIITIAEETAVPRGDLFVAVLLRFVGFGLDTHDAFSSFVLGQCVPDENRSPDHEGEQSNGCQSGNTQLDPCSSIGIRSNWAGFA